jgi:hypothetical protein
MAAGAQLRVAAGLTAPASEVVVTLGARRGEHGRGGAVRSGGRVADQAGGWMNSQVPARSAQR